MIKNHSSIAVLLKSWVRHVTHTAPGPELWMKLHACGRTRTFLSICMFFIKKSESKCACFIIISHCLSVFFLPGSVRWFVNRSRLISAHAACRFCVFSGMYLAYLTLWNLLNFLIALRVRRQLAFVDTQKRHTAVQQAQECLSCILDNKNNQVYYE